MNKLFEKLIAVMLVITLAGANLVLLSSYCVSYALSDSELAVQDTTTENANVEFNAYLEGGVHTETANAEKETKLYLNIKVKNSGYLKNATVAFQDVNFRINGNVDNEYVQSIDTDNNKITLKQINNGSDVTISIPISILNINKVPVDNFSKESKSVFSGIYVDGSGKEKKVSNEIVNKISWNNKAEAFVKAEITKYIPYAQNEKYGVMVQAKINSGITNSKLPIKETNLEVTVPKINEIKPTSVNVIANQTKATNGAEDGIDFGNDNYSYDVETGLVLIHTKNEANNGQIDWTKNSQDEYLVTFIFEGKEIYDEAVANGIDSKISAMANITVYNSEESTVKVLTEESIKAEEKIGTIADFNILASKEIAKGNIYASYSAKEKIETSYWVKYSSVISHLDLTEEVQFAQSYDKFVTEDDKEGLTTINGKNYTYNKNVKISEKMFNKMLGEEGNIEISDINGNVIGTINKETEKDDQGNYVLEISTSNNNQLVIKTTKPISVGTIIIEIEKAISGTIDYSQEQMKDFTKMRTELTGTASTSTVKAEQEIALKEVKSVAQIEISKKDLTTVVKNENVEIRATLDISTLYNALYTNPTLKIKLPSYINKVDLKNAKLLMDGGLIIKSIKLTTESGSQVINIELQGTQTEYVIDAEYKGAILVLNTDLTVKTLTPSNTSKIEMTFTNENKVSMNQSGKTETEVNFVAPVGIVAANGISNYAKGGKDILSIADESANATIETYTAKKIATVTGKIINNYGNKITDVVILGRFPAKDNKEIDSNNNLGSTFDATLNSAIGVSGIDPANYTVYYSNKVDATTDLGDASNGWTKVATRVAKSYMIVTKNYEMESGTVIDFAYNIEIPANLTYNNSAYEMYKVYYNNVSSIGTMAETKVSPILGASTGEGPEVELNVKAMSDTVREGQIVRMTATIKNVGGLKAENAKLLITAPEGTVHTELEKGKSSYTDSTNKEKVISLGDIAVGQTITKEYELKIEKGVTVTTKTDSETGETYTVEESKYPGDKQIQNIIRITADNISGEVKSESYTLNILEGDLSIVNIPNPVETTVLTKGDKLQYKVKLENISNDKDLDNVTLHASLPTGVKIDDIYYVRTGSTEKSKENISINGNDISVNVGKLQSITAYLNSNMEEHDEDEDHDLDISHSEILNICTGAQVYIECSIEDFQGEEKCIMTATADNIDTQYSNVQKLVAEKVELKFTQKELDQRYIKEGTEYTYHFVVENAGDISSISNKMEMTLPEGLSLVKAEYELAGKKETTTYNNNGYFVVKFYELKPGETLDIAVTVKANLLADKNDKEITTVATLSANGLDKMESNKIKVIIEYDANAHQNQGGSGEGTTPTKRYKITGTAWVDANKDGKRDENESILANVPVVLIYKKDNSIVKDPDTKQEKRAITGNNGTYQFDNLPAGEYLVLFLYDAARYSLTTYRAEGIAETLNSDAIDINITLDGQRRLAGITDIVKITDSNVRDIDIGLYTAEKFDLSIEKYISKITLTTPTIGTKTYTYNNEQVTKIEVLEKNVGQSNIVIEYKIVVKNEGAVSGYAKKIVDYLPEHTKFSTEINKDWYLSDNGNVYNASLANVKINPGETKEVTLILTAKITDETIGNILNNNVEIYESYNEQGLQDIDSTPGNKASDEDDMSKADVVLSLVTGKVIMYTTLALGIAVLLGFGIYEIKKRVLIKKKD